MPILELCHDHEEQKLNCSVVVPNKWLPVRHPKPAQWQNERSVRSWGHSVAVTQNSGGLTDRSDADMRSGSRIWPGCRWDLSLHRIEEGVVGGEFISRETGRSAVCRWWLAGAPQLGPPPAWPLGVPHWIQSFVLPWGGQTNSRLIIHWDSNDTG